MGVRITAKGADFSGWAPISVLPQIDNPAQIAGWSWYGRSLRESLINHGSGPDAVVEAASGGAGAPAVARGYVQCDVTTGWLNSRLPEVAAMTVMGIVRVPTFAPDDAATYAASFWSAYVAAETAGPEAGIGANGHIVYASWLDGATTRRPYVQDPNATNGTPAEIAIMRNWAFVAMTVDVTSLGYRDETNARNGGALSGDIIAGARKLSSATLRIGGRPGSGRTTPVDIAFSGVVSRKLNADEIAACYRHVRAQAARRGVTV